MKHRGENKQQRQQDDGQNDMEQATIEYRYSY